MGRLWRLLAGVLMLVSTSSVWGQTEERRVALVIGNSQYLHAAPLPNPINDARAVIEKLRQLGFEVLEGLDLDRAATEQALRRFATLLDGAEIGLFYYAGHGLQVDGRNYLAPTDARLDDVQDLYFEAVDLGLVLSLLEGAPRTSLVFLDACRDNPLARNLARSMGPARSQAIGRGLAPIESGVGTLIAYATQPSNVALDGTGEHSPFTAAVLDYIDHPGLEVRQMLSRVRAMVIKSTGGRQVPWDHSSLIEDFYFAPDQPMAARTETGEEGSTGGSGAVLGPEIVFWQSIEGSQDPDDFRVYLKRFPNGMFAPLALNRLRHLEPAAPEAAPREGGEPAPGQWTVSFRNGERSYTGTQDTYLREHDPHRVYGDHPSINVDDDDPQGSGRRVHALLRFDDIFGVGAGRIPVGAAIERAILTLDTSGRGDGATFHRMLLAWDEGSTWDSMDDGLAADGVVEAKTSADLSTGSVEIGVRSFDVTATVQAWSRGAVNHGWALLPLGRDGWDFSSSEHETVTLRPKLTVTFSPKPDPENLSLSR